MKLKAFLPVILISSFWIFNGSIDTAPNSSVLPGTGIQTLVIDAGHGGKDPGALGRNNHEKDIALAVALQVRRIMAREMPEIKVVLTRETDEFIELHRRGQIAKEAGGDFFISIHCNGLNDRSKAGTETYILGTNAGQESYKRIISENQSILLEEDYRSSYDNFDPNSPEGFIFFSLIKNSYREESIRLATKIQSQFESRLHRNNRGVKQAPFVVLYACGMPAVLTEMGFITNSDEEVWLSSEAGQISVASAIYRSVKEYNLELQVPTAQLD